MKQGTDRVRYRARKSAFQLVTRGLAKGRRGLTPYVPAFRALWRRVPWQLLVLLVGLVVQGALIVLVWQLVDLCVSLMEVWLELARKHLEVTLS